MEAFFHENRNSEVLLLSSSRKERKSEKSTLFGDSKDFVAVLPIDVTELVIEKLDILGYIRFSAVNKLWRSILIDSAARGAQRGSLQQLPWLVLYKNANMDKSKPYPGFFSLFNEKHFRLDLPELCGALCRGSSYGWLIVAAHGAIFLLNPFTRRRIQLLSSVTFSFINYLYVSRPYYIQKAVLLPPSIAATDDSVANFDVDNCTVVAIHGSGRLAYCRPSDQAWIHHIEPGSRHKWVLDIIYHNGKLYGLQDDFDLSEIELGSPIRIKLLHLPCPVGYGRKSLVLDWNHKFLVESYGELLLVVKDDLDDAKLPPSFNVFKFDSSNHCWAKLESLVDLMLFVGQNNSISLSVNLFTGFEGNCVYFTDQSFVEDKSKLELNSVELCANHPKACRFVGVFSLATKRVKYFCSFEHKSKFNPMWFMPCLP